MPRFFNTDHSPVIVVHGERAVMPGESHNFTEEQVAAGLTGSWSKDNPRAGLAAERAFKRRRDADPDKQDEQEPTTDSEGGAATNGD